MRRIGFGIYWLTPALFSDISAAWTLSRWQRVAVDCGGIYFQLLLCCLFAIAASFITSAATQLALQIAIIVNLVAVITALNPILKYDGYWIISDALSIPNLRRQSEHVMRDFACNMFTRSGHKISAGVSGLFLLGYGVVSLLYSIALLFLFAIVIRQNAAQAIQFPQEAWTFFVTGLRAGNAASQLLHLALDFMKVIPIACAPIALLSATSAVAGFFKRTFSKSRLISFEHKARHSIGLLMGLRLIQRSTSQRESSLSLDCKRLLTPYRHLGRCAKNSKERLPAMLPPAVKQIQTHSNNS